MRFFGGHQRESFLQVKPHLVTEHAARARARSIAFIGAVFQNIFK